MKQKQNKQNLTSEFLTSLLPNATQSGEVLKSRGFVLCDDAFQILSPPAKHTELLMKLPIHWIRGGEQCKSIAKAQEVWRWLEASGANRFDTIIVIGGGTVMDLGAFVATTYKRGVKFILMPTTLLGMVDASIGGKNGINFNGVKNSIGSFNKPTNVCVDVEWINTLPTSELLNGWMELSKHALISDASLWEELQTKTPVDEGIDWDQIVRKGTAIKQRIVDADFHEQGERKQLNFGHTIGHALESLAAREGMALDHGFAVGIGMIASLNWSAQSVDEIANQKSIIKAASALRRLLKTDANCDTWNWCVKQSPEQLWPFMLKDKKNQSNTVLDIRLREIGSAEWDCPLTQIDFETFWKAAF
jgi:3-dehydroquinate synthase